MPAIIPYLGGSYKFSLGLDDVIIGDPQNGEFKPVLELARWNKESRLKLIFDDSKLISKNVVLEDDKVKYSTPLLDIHYFPINPTEQCEDGGVELEIILKQKPPINTIDLPVETENLVWYYQPPLTQEFRQEDCEVWTETHVRLKPKNETETGQDVFRPENVIGSYAIYHTSKRNNEYKTGKAFHLYRVQLIDANGNKTWAEYNKNIQETGRLGITLPQEFLNKAVYPVTIDPTFGKTSIGGTTVNTAQDLAIQCQFSVGESGTLTQISYYTKAGTQGDGKRILRLGLYDNNKNLETSNSSTEYLTGTPTWHNQAFNYVFTSGTKHLVAQTDIRDRTSYYDTGETNQWGEDTLNGALPNPFVDDNSYVRELSIYATYTTAGPALKEITDSLGLSDSVFGHKTLAISDSLGLSDATPRRDKTFSILDATYLSEQAPLTDRALPVSDAVALTEGLLTDKILTILDQTYLSDFSIVNKIQEILDSVWLSEQILVELGKLAKIVVFNVQKQARRTGKAVIAATTHTDLFEDLGPNVHIHKGWGKRLQIKYCPDKPRIECTVAKGLRITEGTLKDYEKLAEFHYRNPRTHAIPVKIFVMKKFDAEPVGVIFYSYPPLAMFGRRKALGRNAGIEELNKDFATISRVILHPKYRSIGLGIKLVKETLPLVGKQYVETMAVMARYNPFFEKAGMQKIAEAKGDSTVQKAVKDLEKLGFKPYALASRETNLNYLKQLELTELQKVKESLLSISQGYYKRLKGSGKAYVRKEEFNKFVAEASTEKLAKVISRLAVLAQTKVYLLWKNPSFEKTDFG
jgi:GNAT superfamily N-acetyltransferase